MNPARKRAKIIGALRLQSMRLRAVIGSLQSPAMTLRKLALFTLPLFVTARPLLADPPAAEFRNGRWETLAPATVKPASDPELDHMEQLLGQKEPSAALSIGSYWVKHHDKKAPQRDRLIYLLAEANYQLDDRIRAFYFLDELMDEYPQSALFYPALEKQYQIADGFLNGHKLRVLGAPVLSGNDEAVEMLFRIQQRSPGSPLSEKALLRTADFYYASGEYQLAHDAYGYYVKSYPRSDSIPKVKLRQAFASLAQFRGLKFDATSMLDARAELTDVISAYPELSRSERLPNVVKRIDAALASKLYLTADYFRRTRTYGGAVYMYRYLIAAYPDSADVPAAKKALDGMPRSALDQPAPQLTEQFPAAARGGA